jgi:chemotaxis protein MotA
VRTLERKFMNFSGILGVAATLAIFSMAILTSTDTKEIFLNEHAILVVVGGTAAATLLCFPFKTVFTLLKVFFQRILGRHNQKCGLLIEEIVGLAAGYREDDAHLTNDMENIDNKFLQEAVGLMTQGGITPEELDLILEKRADTHFRRYEEEAGIFKIVSKFPPAFGLMGTTLGMIGLLQGIGSSDSFKTLGPNMAIALVATFYGIAMANLVLIPIGENLSKWNKDDEVLRQIVMEGIRLIRVKTHPLVVREYLKSYQLPSERKSLEGAA